MREFWIIFKLRKIFGLFWRKISLNKKRKKNEFHAYFGQFSGEEQHALELCFVAILAIGGKNPGGVAITLHAIYHQSAKYCRKRCEASNQYQRCCRGPNQKLAPITRRPWVFETRTTRKTPKNGQNHAFLAQKTCVIKHCLSFLPTFHHFWPFLPILNHF